MSITKDLCDEIDALKEEIMELKEKMTAAEERAELAEQKVEEMVSDNERLREVLGEIASDDWNNEDWARAIAKEALK